MYTVRCVMPLALGWLSVGALLRAQQAAPSLPAIFAPRPVEARASPVSGSSPAAAVISERMHRTITERVLSDPKIFEAPGAVTPAAEKGATVSDGVLLMNPLIVKATVLRDSEVRFPPAPLLSTVGRKHPTSEASGVSANLFRQVSGGVETRIDLNILKVNFSGTDHALETTRVEIAFKRSW